MEPFNQRLHDVLMLRWDELDEDEQRLVFATLAVKKPALAVMAMNYAREVAESVSEDLSDS